jgi:ATP-binding cassette subfamily B protein
MIDASLRRAFSYVVPQARRLALVLVLSLVSTGLSLYLPLLTRDLVDTALIGRDPASLVRVVLMFAGITLVSFGLNVVSGLRYTRVSADILFEMRLAMYRHLQRLSPRFYARTRFGDIMSRINNDIGEIQRVAAETALAWVGNVLFLIGTVAILMWMDPRLFLVSVAVTPLSLWALAYYRRRLEEQVTVLRQSSSDIGSFLVETLQGVKLVVTSNAQDREVDRFRARNDAFVRALMSMQWLGYLAGGLPGLILSAGVAVVFLYGGQRVMSGAITVGTFVAFMAYQMRLLSPIQGLMGLYSNLATVRVSLRRVCEILDAPPDVVEQPDAAPLTDVRGNVEFKDVTLSFDRGGPVLERLSFAVQAGEVLAIVGPSGSGKSTVTDLLLRLLDPDSGSVWIDGRDLRTIRLHDVRHMVALVDQDPCILHASIAENLRYACPWASDADLQRVAHAAALDTFIERLPEKFDTVVGERGMALSAGERQRIAIARAFLADPAILVLDEPTAALDPISEERVIAGYRAAMRDRTTIVITHRLELACEADRVVVLDGARVVEQGAPHELRALQGAFHDLFRLKAV